MSKIAFFIQHPSDIFVWMMQSTIFHSTNCIYKSAIHFFSFCKGQPLFRKIVYILFCSGTALKKCLGGGANFAQSAKYFFAPPPRKILGRGGQIIFHSFTEETLDQGGKFMSLFPQNHVKIA